MVSNEQQLLSLAHDNIAGFTFKRHYENKNDDYTYEGETEDEDTSWMHPSSPDYDEERLRAAVTEYYMLVIEKQYLQKIKNQGIKRGWNDDDDED